MQGTLFLNGETVISIKQKAEWPVTAKPSSSMEKICFRPRQTHRAQALLHVCRDGMQRHSDAAQCLTAGR